MVFSRMCVLYKSAMPYRGAIVRPLESQPGAHLAKLLSCPRKRWIPELWKFVLEARFLQEVRGGCSPEYRSTACVTAM